MKKIIELVLLLASALLFAFACKDPYMPKISGGTQEYLAVDGFINATPGAATRIRLTHTTGVNDTAAVAPLHGATVQVIQGGNTYTLPETGDSGYYQVNAMALTAGTCGLLIKTADNKHFESDSIPILDAGILDTVVYAPRSDGLQLYLDAHRGGATNTYYRWDYIETWEYHPPYESTIAYDWSKRMLRIRTREEDDSLYRCFQTAASNSIELATTASLSENNVYHYPITFIPPASVKLSVGYSILVNQYALDAAAYNYYLLLKKTTQGLGDVFGPIPTQLKSNIHPADGSGDIVIGYMTASTVAAKRIFITHDNVYWWKFGFDYDRLPSSKMAAETGVALDAEHIYYFERQSVCAAVPPATAPPPCDQPYSACCSKAYPLHNTNPGALLYAYDSICADCMFWGQGARKKPAFWPN